MSQRIPKAKTPTRASTVPERGARGPLENFTPDDAPETQKVNLAEGLTDPALEVAFHRRVASRHLREGSYDRAFGALVEASRAAPVSVRLASEMVRVASLAKLEIAAAAELEDALAEAKGPRALGLRHALVRAYRRMGKLAKARAHAEALVQGSPGSNRARALLSRLFMLEANWTAALALLDEEGKLALAAGKPQLAWRAALERGRLLSDRLGDGEGAAKAFAEAAGHASAAGHARAAFSAWTLAARALSGNEKTRPELAKALAALTEAGRAAGREDEAVRLVAELGSSAGESGARMLVALAEEAQGRGAHREAKALLEAAVALAPDDRPLASRLEALYVARAAWHELAAHYRKRSEREKAAGLKKAAAELLMRLAELLEDELADAKGAAQAWGEVVALTGDAAALTAQLRLLGDDAAIDRALEDALKSGTSATRAEALLLRAERHQTAGRRDDAAKDFRAALDLAPDSVRALAGVAECRPDASAVRALQQAVAAQPRGARGRAELARRLSRLLEGKLGDAQAARQFWREVLTEVPDDAEAEGRLLHLARGANDSGELIELLRGRLSREPRGPQARAARHELARALESLGRQAEAHQAWLEAARVEPGDAVALLALADRDVAAGHVADAVFHLEGAAAATEPGPERAAIWSRAAELYRWRIGDEEKAKACEERAQVKVSSDRVQVRPLPPAALPEQAPGPEELSQSHIELVEEPPPAAAEPAPALELEERPASFSAEPERYVTTDPRARERSEKVLDALNRMDEDPLAPGNYRTLADLYEDQGDAARTGLMREIADALEGDPLAEPRAPKTVLNGTHWNALRHPELRGSIIELFTLSGAALCSAWAQSAKATRSGGPFSVELGPGAPRAAEAIADAARILGLRVPDLVASEALSPPLLALNTDPPRVSIGRAAIRDALPQGELRFFAGRALFTFRAEVTPLRFLTVEEITNGLAALDALVRGNATAKLSRQLEKRIAPSARARIAELLTRIARKPPNLDRLIEAARRTANRVGLVAAGGVAPAVAALRAKRGATDELADLMRFAASDRYLSLPRR